MPPWGAHDFLYLIFRSQRNAFWRGQQWAERFGEVTVVNGPSYSEHPDHLHAGVTVPDFCWSVVIRHELAGLGMIAFKIPNRGNPAGPLNRYLVSPKEIESDTSLDLFAGQSEKVRAANEGRRWERLWN